MTVEERFWQKVDIRSADECWLWTACKTPSGYGSFGPINGYGHRAHRIAWIFTNGPIPDGLCVCHHCDKPLCCNPKHLFLGTQLDNMRDAISKGRVLNEEHRRRISEAQQGNKNGVGHKNWLGRHHSEEAKRKISATLMGHPISDDTRRKISETLRRRNAHREGG